MPVTNWDMYLEDKSGRGNFKRKVLQADKDSGKIILKNAGQGNKIDASSLR